jgi:ABC-2 type transport system ATP-binding protein
LKNLHHPLVRAEAVERVIQQTRLRGVAHQRIHTLSGGMKRRVGIAQALLGSPRLLIVDEPTAGLDPEERVRFRNLLANLAADSVVILSTHIVEDVASTCSALAVLSQGEIRFHGSTQDLIQAAHGMAWEMDHPFGLPVDPEWRVVSQIQTEKGLRLRVVGERPVESAQAATPTLEEAYMLLMGGEEAS